MVHGVEQHQMAGAGRRVPAKQEKTADDLMEGYVYCMSNPAMPGLLKVGFTTDTPDVRARELYTTGVPLPFKVEFAKLIANPKEKEMATHKLLGIYHERVNNDREFFRVTKERVREIFDLLEGEYFEGEFLQPTRLKNPHKIYVVEREE